MGDFLLAQITYEKGTDNTVAGFQGPSGWTQLFRTDRGTDIGQAVFYKFAVASDVTATSYTWTFSQSMKAAGGILRYTGVDPVPIVASSGNTGESNPLTALSVNATANSRLVAFFGVKKTTNLSNPSGMSSIYQVQNPQDITSRASDEVRSTAGATGSRTSTATAVDKWVAQLVALREAPEPDGDGDGVPDSTDNCPLDANPLQEDSDEDGTGDACDVCPFDADNDVDEDGFCAANADGPLDNCPDVANPDQIDTDGDGVGDACDPDIDGDGVNNEDDECPLDFDNLCNADDDGDGDGIPDLDDVCMETPAGQAVDEKGCSIAENCPCENEWKNHGAYVSCVSTAAENLLDLGYISETEKGAIVSAAGASQCGKKK